MVTCPDGVNSIVLAKHAQDFQPARRQNLLEAAPYPPTLFPPNHHLHTSRMALSNRRITTYELYVQHYELRSDRKEIHIFLHNIYEENKDNCNSDHDMDPSATIVPSRILDGE